ncbi:MAG: Flp pilus assembly protein CpaB [Chloroflexota bacterium]|nr:Flp pilus assembly protein CpaB [Chloroflexota bacterium]MDE3193936.1 Flp pilus assembly protein CpaB [Chloroflexota bacterium]
MDPKRRARLILIVGVLLALITFGATFVVVQGAQSAAPPPPVPTVSVIVAARDIPARTALTAADLKVAKMEQAYVPPKSVKDPKEVIGKILIQPVYVGEPILTEKFAPTERAFTVFPAGVEVQPGSPAYRIMTIAVPDNNAVGGILVPGDNVDIMYVFSFDPCAKLQIGTGTTPGTQCAASGTGTTTGGAAATTPQSSSTTPQSPITSDTVAKIILGPIQILARNAAVYTIRVDAALAERLAYIQAAGGSLQLLLRAPTDDRAANTTGATFSSVYTQFKFPIPERVKPLPTP